MLLQKGKQYQNTRKQKADEKSCRELEGCSFKPSINSVNRGKENSRSNVHEALYEMGRRLSKERQPMKTTL